MDPVKIAVTDHNAVGPDGDDEFSRPIEEASSEAEELMIDEPTVKEIKSEPPTPTPAKSKSYLFLYKYVTTLVSGLILLGLIAWSGATLVDYWLGDAAKPNMFSEFVYRYQLYLVAGLVLFGALHVVQHWLTAKVITDDQPTATKVFRAIFLTILVLTVVGGLVTFAYVGADMALGTANYSTKQLWMIVLDTLLVIGPAALLWWYFQQSRPRAVIAYVASVAVMVIVAAALLVAFPILKQRDSVIDTRTSSDLSVIADKIDTYAQKNNALPAGLGNLELDDPVKGRLSQYSYEASQEKKSTEPTINDLSQLYRTEGVALPSSTRLSYKLCATFKTDTTKDAKDDIITPLFGTTSAWTNHPSGRHCFDQTVYGSSSGSSPARPEDSSDLLKDIETL